MAHDMTALSLRAGRANRKAWYRAADAPRWATAVVFHGSGQTVQQMLSQFSVPEWTGAGVNVVALQARASAGRMWLPASRAMFSDSDLEAVRGLLASIPSSMLAMPVWFMGHSGGGCFAHTAAWWTATRQPVPGVRVGGVVCNAGWLWSWMFDEIVGLREKYPVCFRVGSSDPFYRDADFDPGEEPNDGFYGANLYESLGHEVRRKKVVSLRHEWLAPDDTEMRAWMQSTVE